MTKQVEQIPYIEIQGDMWHVSHKPLNSTGKWALEYFPNRDDPVLFIQHRYLKFFTKWVHEDVIVFRNKRTSMEYDCNG